MRFFVPPLTGFLPHKWHTFCIPVVVKKQYNHFVKSGIFLFLVLILSNSCSRVKGVKEIFDKPTARERYERDFENDSPEYSQWESSYRNALLDSIAIQLPYTEAGKFFPSTAQVYTYDFSLSPGERLKVTIETDLDDPLLFIDLFRKDLAPANSFTHLESAEYKSTTLQYEVDEAGIYKLLIQPEIAASSPFRINIYKEPVYAFPVAGKGNSAIQSVWGAAREGGRRSHEGIDIFAPRGTPVIAVTGGRIASTGNKGLGGKQVWLRDRKRGNSLYYAHLDSITISSGANVSPGDTLGFVGNTGNAKTTSPHLHFGIYNGFNGARDPLPYVYLTTRREELNTISTPDFLIATGTANLRKGPSTKAKISSKVYARDTLQVLGQTYDWYHTRLREENFYIHKSLVEPL